LTRRGDIDRDDGVSIFPVAARSASTSSTTLNPAPAQLAGRPVISICTRADAVSDAEFAIDKALDSRPRKPEENGSARS
jgi:hypothetical protein